MQHCVDLAAAVAEGVVVVVPADLADQPVAGAVVVAGGDTRSASVRAGLAALPDDVELVIVHDAARPAASPELFAAVHAALVNGAQAVIPGLPVVDTIKQVAERDGRRVVARTLDRGTLVAVQTPQGFRANRLREAHASGAEATDDAALVEALGVEVVVVPGEATNLKLTNPADLGSVEATLAARRSS